MKAVAFKATYNDGGADGRLIGYRGVCSEGVMVDNIIARRMTCCSEKTSPCRQFVDNQFQGKRPQIGPDEHGPCYEATLLDPKRGFRFGAGYYDRRSRDGKAIPMSRVEPGDIAILTTLRPQDRQEERFIFGLFRIKSVGYDAWWGYSVESDGQMNIVLPDEVARRTLFWRYFKNAKGPNVWGAGLFRYLSDEQTSRLLADVLALLGDSDDRDLLLRVLKGKITPAPFPPGIERSFGGEGKRHRRLRWRVHGDPTTIGLPRGAVHHEAYCFDSGDRVDLMFDLPGGGAAVVEIETDWAYPGAHRCVKYRALLEAKRGEAIGSGNVEAVLVACSFDSRTRQFAAKYGIRLVCLEP